MTMAEKHVRIRHVARSMLYSEVCKVALEARSRGSTGGCKSCWKSGLASRHVLWKESPFQSSPLLTLQGLRAIHGFSDPAFSRR